MARKKRRPDEEPDESSQPEPTPEPQPKPESPSKARAKPKAEPGPRGGSGAKAKTPKTTGGKKPGAAARGKRPGKASLEIDWKVIEQAMWRMLGREAPADEDDPKSPRSRAMALVQRAYREPEASLAVALAREAIDTWPDCAEALVLLAEQSRNPKESLEHYARATEAAARDLGEAAFRVGVGHFWSALPTRPYMRARLGLAQMHWVVGHRDEAVTHYQELLRLNPGDNQGVRYLLASALVELGRDDELDELLKRYEDDGSACWAYTAALWAFRRDGDGPGAREELERARRVNRYVPDYLTGRATFPSEMPDSVGVGDRSEAIDYAAGHLSGWRATPGALEWLRRSAQKTRTRTPRLPAAKGPTAAAKKRLARLPQTDEVWQADARQLPVWVNVPDDPYRPWVILVADLTQGLILGQHVCEVLPSPEFFWDKVTRLISHPSEGEPVRPAAFETAGGGRWDELAPHFREIGVEFVTSEPLDAIDELVRNLVEHVNGRPPMPGLLDMPGVTPEQVASFYQAAAAFYRLAPWQRIGGAETIKVACDRFESSPWYAVVFGQMGMTLGVALYDDLKTLMRIRDGHASDEDNARATVALSFTYGTMTEVAVADLDAAEAFGWEVAAPDAYPSPVRKERGLSMRAPLAWELRVLEATLRALPRFIEHHDRDDHTPETFTVPTGTEPLRLELSWVADPPEK